MQQRAARSDKRATSPVKERPESIGTMNPVMYSIPESQWLLVMDHYAMQNPAAAATAAAAMQSWLFYKIHTVTPVQVLNNLQPYIVYTQRYTKGARCHTKQHTHPSCYNNQRGTIHYSTVPEPINQQNPRCQHNSAVTNRSILPFAPCGFKFLCTLPNHLLQLIAPP